MTEPSLRIGSLTLSDRASKGVYKDLSGPAIRKWFTTNLVSEVDVQQAIIPDSEEQLTKTLESWVQQNIHLIITTGGTGPAPRDITPDVTTAFCDKLLPGFSEQMRAYSLQQGIPTAVLSRQVVGIKEQTLIINLPGSPNAIKDCLDSVARALPYCIELIGGPLIDLNTQYWSPFWPKDSRHHQRKRKN